MYLLVNLEGHVANMADIINELVNKYSVPISIVDSIDRACPNCKGHLGTGGQSSQAPPKDPELPPISPAYTTEIIDVKPNRALLDGETSMGRRTAAKHSSVPKSLERKQNVEEKPFSSEIQKLLAQASCSRGERESHSPSNSYTSNTGGVNSPNDSSGEAEENGNASVDDFGASLETMHPTLLACLISSTPNVFAQEEDSSPNGDTPPNLIPEGVFKTDCSYDDEQGSDAATSRLLDQLKYSVSSSGKLRRGRIVYNSRDLDVLESFYSKDPNACADPMKKQQMMELLGVDAIRLKVWFQNRRRKDKIKWLKENH